MAVEGGFARSIHLLISGGRYFNPTKGPIQRFLKIRGSLLQSADECIANWDSPANTGSQGALTIILGAIDGRFPEKPFSS